MCFSSLPVALSIECFGLMSSNWFERLERFLFSIGGVSFVKCSHCITPGNVQNRHIPWWLRFWKPTTSTTWQPPPQSSRHWKAYLLGLLFPRLSQASSPPGGWERGKEGWGDETQRTIEEQYANVNCLQSELKGRRGSDKSAREHFPGPPSPGPLGRGPWTMPHIGYSPLRRRGGFWGFGLREGFVCRHGAWFGFGCGQSQAFVLLQRLVRGAFNGGISVIDIFQNCPVSFRLVMTNKSVFSRLSNDFVLHVVMDVVLADFKMATLVARGNIKPCQIFKRLI